MFLWNNMILLSEILVYLNPLLSLITCTLLLFKLISYKYKMARADVIQVQS